MVLKKDGVKRYLKCINNNPHFSQLMNYMSREYFGEEEMNSIIKIHKLSK